MTRWIEPSTLWKLVERDSMVTGGEPPEVVILREPKLLIRVAGPALPPLDINTYAARYTRWQDGRGPRLTGMDHFMEILQSLDKPACAVAIQGAHTSYTYLLDAELSRVLSGVAIDPPVDDAGR